MEDGALGVATMSVVKRYEEEVNVRDEIRRERTERGIVIRL